MRVCVFTAVFGGFDIVLPPLGSNEGIDFIAFADGQARLPDPWQVRHYVGPPGLSPRLKARYVKLGALPLLPEYDLSIWVDGNARPSTDLQPLIDEFIQSGKSIALIRHPERCSIVDEAAACERFGKVSTDGVPRMMRRVERYLLEGLRDDRLWENNVVFRRHDDARVIDAGSLWWSEVDNHCIRDQISLPYILWRTGLHPHIWSWTTRGEGSPFPIHRHRISRFEDVLTYCDARRKETSAFEILDQCLRTARHAVRRMKRGCVASPLGMSRPPLQTAFAKALPSETASRE